MDDLAVGGPDLNQRRAPVDLPGQEVASQEDPEEVWTSSMAQGNSLEDMDTGSGSLDVNLVAGLVGWVSAVKGQMGYQWLMALVDLYIRSCRPSLGLKELIVHICGMVREEQSYDADASQDYLVLMYQLHGILTGSSPIVRIPKMELSTTENLETDWRTTDHEG